MNKSLCCPACGKAFVPEDSDWKRIERFAAKGADFIAIECPHCLLSSGYNPVEIIHGSAASKSDEASIQLRCPVQRCTGWVVEVDDGESTFWGCGACGTVWATRGALSGAITRCVKKFPYREVAYVRKGSSWDPAPAEADPDGYERQVEKEP